MKPLRGVLVMVVLVFVAVGNHQISAPFDGHVDGVSLGMATVERRRKCDAVGVDHRLGCGARRRKIG